MAMGESTGNDSTFENLVDEFSQVEQDENKNADEEETRANKIREVVLNEGEFSWHTSDHPHDPIYSTEGHQKTVYMIDDKGNQWKETNYEGYGVFGGKDFYELLAEMNGLEPDRELGINLVFKDNPSGDDTEGVKYPKLVENPNLKYDAVPNPKGHKGQGWFEEEAEEEMDIDAEYEDEYEDDFNENKKGIVESLSPTGGTAFEQLVGKFSQVEKDSNKNVDEGKDIITPTQNVTPFEKVLESCQHALDEKEEVEEAKGDRLIKDVVDGWRDNFEDVKFKNSVEVLDMLDTKVRAGAWGKKIHDLFEMNDEWRDKLEKAIVNLVKELGGLEATKEAIDEGETVEEEITDEACGKKHEVEEEAVADAHLVAKDEDEAIRVKHPLVKDEKCDKEKVKEDAVEEDAVEEGLAGGSDNLIYIAKESLGEGWDVFKTREGSNASISMFTLNTEEEALEAGQKIADAIGGEFRGKEDPRVDPTRREAASAVRTDEPLGKPKWGSDEDELGEAEEVLTEEVEDWQKFMDKHGFTDDELDRFAVNMGFDSLSDMANKISPGILRKRDPEKFEGELSTFVGTKDEDELGEEEVVEEDSEVEEEVKEEVMDEQGVKNVWAVFITEPSKKRISTWLPEPKAKEFAKLLTGIRTPKAMSKEAAEKEGFNVKEEVVKEEVLDEKKLKDISDEKLRQFKVDLSGMTEWSRAEDLYLAVEKELDRRAKDKD